MKVIEKVLNKKNIIAQTTAIIISREDYTLKSEVYNEHWQANENGNIFQPTANKNLNFNIDSSKEIGVLTEQVAYKTRHDMKYWERTCLIRFFKTNTNSYIENVEFITININSLMLRKIILNHNDHANELFSTIKRGKYAYYLNQNGEEKKIELNSPVNSIYMELFDIAMILRMILIALHSIKSI
ncbi:MAG: hypothetical protein U0U67_02160 [Chitinophagales bacterium]